MGEPCLICQIPGTKVAPTNNDEFSVECDGCGDFRITGSAARVLALNPLETHRQRANARGWMGDNPGIVLSAEQIAQLRALSSPTVGERAEKLLVAMSKRHPDVGEQIVAFDESGNSAFWLAASWSDNLEELTYLIRAYLGKTKRWIDETATGLAFLQVEISPSGHDHIANLAHSGSELDSGFCAMWFSDEVRPIWTDAIEPAIRASGYRPVRIDGVEHNNKIDDEILANIRRARFIVADFTGERGGVYFEAGFALGLGRQVVWTVREDFLSKVHFDNRQYNFLVWKSDDLPDFQRRLQLRIEATIGRGPH